MKKTILILDGIAIGKTQTIDAIKQAGIWNWNCNVMNLLSFMSHKLGWEGKRNSNYYEFIKEFYSLANKYFNYEEYYTNLMIDKFYKSEKCQTIIIHNMSDELQTKLKEGNKDVYKILVTEGEAYIKEGSNIDQIINWKDDNFHETLINLIKILAGKEEK